MKEESCPIWSRVKAGGEIVKEGVGRKSRWRHWQQWIRDSPPLKSFGRAGNGTPLQYSFLENPMDGGAWWAAVHGVAKSPTRLSDFTFTFHFLALEKEMASHSSVLAWRIPGVGEPGGLPSMGSHRVRHDWSDLATAPAKSFGGKQKVSGLLMAQSMAFSYFMWLFYERWLQNGWRL